MTFQSFGFMSCGLMFGFESVASPVEGGMGTWEVIILSWVSVILGFLWVRVDVGMDAGEGEGECSVGRVRMMTEVPHWICLRTGHIRLARRSTIRVSV